MKTYTLKELLALREEYLLTLDNNDPDEWYLTEREIYDRTTLAFLSWLNLKEWIP